jgi:hypothetical protein
LYFQIDESSKKKKAEINNYLSIKDTLIELFKSNPKTEETKMDYERNIENEMKNKYFMKTDEDLILEANIDDPEEQKIIRRFGLWTLINIYCAPTLKFHPIHFKDGIVKLGLSYGTSCILYILFEKWRSAANTTYPSADVSSLSATTIGITLDNRIQVSSSTTNNNNNPESTFEIYDANDPSDPVNEMAAEIEEEDLVQYHPITSLTKSGRNIGKKHLASYILH